MDGALTFTRIRVDSSQTVLEDHRPVFYPGPLGGGGGLLPPQTFYSPPPLKFAVI